MALLVVFELSCESLLLLLESFTMIVGQGLQLRDEVLFLLLKGSCVALLELSDLVPMSLFLSL